MLIVNYRRYNSVPTRSVDRSRLPVTVGVCTPTAILLCMRVCVWKMVAPMRPERYNSTAQASLNDKQSQTDCTSLLSMSGVRMTGRVPQTSSVAKGGADRVSQCCTVSAAPAGSTVSDERRVRMLSAQRDLRLGLPVSLSLPDGEEFPASANRWHIRSPEQEEEIYQGCVRAPPNRTANIRELPRCYTSGRRGRVCRLISSYAKGMPSVVSEDCVKTSPTSEAPVIQGFSSTTRPPPPLAVVVPCASRKLPRGSDAHPEDLPTSSAMLEDSSAADPVYALSVALPSRLEDVRSVSCRGVAPLSHRTAR